jgi:hypothetical protein
MENNELYYLDLFGDIYTFPKIDNSDKYLVCTCAKNENEYIKEWVDHYLNLNFDKIIICDNNDDDSLLGVLEWYINNGLVEIFDCRGFDCFQVQFYTMFCKEGNYKWCGYFDCDEFLEIPLYNDIKEYLKTKNDDLCVSFHWMVYGSNGKLHKEDGTVKERFPFPVSPISVFTENCFIKSIVRGGDFFKWQWCKFNGSHIPMTEPMFKHNIGGYYWTNSTRHCYMSPRYKEGYIRHYYTKSFDEWVEKRGRGWPDGTNTLIFSNYFICDDWAKLPQERMMMGLFAENDKLQEEEFRAIFNEYAVIKVTNDEENIYGFLLGMYKMLNSTTNTTFVIFGEHIDDTTYNMVLEYGIKTGNRVLYGKTDDDMWRAYWMYRNENNKTYYIINLN